MNFGNESLLSPAIVRWDRVAADVASTHPHGGVLPTGEAGRNKRVVRLSLEETPGVALLVVLESQRAFARDGREARVDPREGKNGGPFSAGRAARPPRRCAFDTPGVE